MYKVYDPMDGFRLIGRASTIEEAFELAKKAAERAKREQWVDDKRGVLCAVAMPA